MEITIKKIVFYLVVETVVICLTWANRKAHQLKTIDGLLSHKLLIIKGVFAVAKSHPYPVFGQLRTVTFSPFARNPP